MAKLYNLARMSTATTGTGTITLGSAVTGYVSFATAGVSDAEEVTYSIVDGNAREVGRGTYTASGTTLTRSVLKSTTGSALNLSGSAEVAIALAAEDIIHLDVANTWTATQTFYASDDTASSGPDVYLDRNSASPAANDYIGVFRFRGRDSGAAWQEYSAIQARIVDPTAASEDGVLHVWNTIAGSLGLKLLIGNGLYSNGATGGDQGVDTANFAAYYINGTNLLDRANTWTANQIISTTVSGSTLTLITSDTGSTGARIIFNHNSASPANNDTVGLIRFDGKDNGGNSVQYSRMASRIVDVTDTTEDGHIAFANMVTGTLTDTVKIAQGLWTNNATSGDMGTDTINASAYYINGTNLFANTNSWTGTNTWTGDGINKFTTSVSAGIPLIVEGTDAGTNGPQLYIFHNSASPATTDQVGFLSFRGNDSGASAGTYASLAGHIVDATATSEDGLLSLRSQVAGTTAARYYVGQGLYSANATSGDQGADTVNLKGLYVDGSDALLGTITFIIDGGGSAITTGVKGDLEIPFKCTIQAATLLADQSGSIVIDIWKDTYANYPPTVADTITASAKPTLSAATKSQDTTLTGWTTAITAGDTLRFNVDSASTVTRVTISLKVKRS